MASVGPFDVPGGEEREQILCALPEGAAGPTDLDARSGNTAGHRGGHGLHHLLALGLVGFAVGGDDALVDAPGRFNLDVLLDGEHRLDAGALLIGEEVDTGVQGVTGAVERVAGVATVPEGVLLDPLPGPVQRVAGEADNAEGIHDWCRVGKLFRGGGLEAGEPVHRDHVEGRAIPWAGQRATA